MRCRRVSGFKMKKLTKDFQNVLNMIMLVIHLMHNDCVMNVYTSKRSHFYRPYNTINFSNYTYCDIKIINLFARWST